MDKHSGLIYTEKQTLLNELLPDRIENRDNKPDTELSANLTNNFVIIIINIIIIIVLYCNQQPKTSLW